MTEQQRLAAVVASKLLRNTVGTAYTLAAEQTGKDRNLISEAYLQEIFLPRLNKRYPDMLEGVWP